MDDTPRPIVEHLDELRRRLFRVIGTWIALACLAGIFAREVFEILMGPAVDAVRGRGHTLIAIAPPELFLTYVKTALLAGFLGAMPVILWQAWAFIAPGLYANERRFALPFVLSTSSLFAVGCLFGYFVAFPQAFEFLLSLEADYVETAWTTQQVFAFMSRLYLAFGLAFELPVVIVALALVGVVTPQGIARQRRYAILVMFIVSALLTPQDVASQVLLAIPLCLLYEASIWMSWLLVGRRSREKDLQAT
jgi:sec-independent protein translocase protein TatC